MAGLAGGWECQAGVQPAGPSSMCTPPGRAISEDPAQSPGSAHSRQMPHRLPFLSLSNMPPAPDDVQACVLCAFDALPAKCKPRARDSTAREWVPLAGIVLSKGTHLMSREASCFADAAASRASRRRIHADLRRSGVTTSEIHSMRRTTKLTAGLLRAPFVGRA